MRSEVKKVTSYLSLPRGRGAGSMLRAADEGGLGPTKGVRAGRGPTWTAG